MKRSASFDVGGRNPTYCVILRMKTLRIYFLEVVYIMLSQQGGFYSEILWCDQYMKAAEQYFLVVLFGMLYKVVL